MACKNKTNSYKIISHTQIHTQTMPWPLPWNVLKAASNTLGPQFITIFRVGISVAKQGGH